MTDDSVSAADDQRTILARAIADCETLRTELDVTRGRLADALERVEAAERDAYFLRLQSVVTESYVDDLNRTIDRFDSLRRDDAASHESALLARSHVMAAAADGLTRHVAEAQADRRTLEVMCAELVASYNAAAKRAGSAEARMAEIDDVLRAEIAETQRQVRETELLTHDVVTSKFWRLKLWLRRLTGSR